MAADNDQTDELFKGLEALSAATFPKRCANCGRSYTSLDDFVKETEAISGRSGLKESSDDDDQPIVELFRNCVCGSTLMDCFNERRDVSEKGLYRRRLFDKLMKMLEFKGLSTNVARSELLKTMHGERSAVLEKMGIKTQVR